jgi:hypothetical protein
MSDANIDCLVGLDGAVEDASVMEPQIAVDLHSMDDIVAQIWSLEVRAAARESEAIDSTDSTDKYRLTLESCELREEVRKLKSWHIELVAGQWSNRIDTKEFIQP